MSDSESIQIRLPFSAQEFPELKGLPAKEAESIIQRCMESPQLESLARRQTSYFRVAMIACFFTLGVLAALMSLEYQVPFVAVSAIFVITILTIPISFAISHVRSSRMLRQLIAKEFQGET